MRLTNRSILPKSHMALVVFRWANYLPINVMTELTNLGST